MKYPLGHVVIEWEEGYSEALIYQDHDGVQYFVCANWVSGPCPVNKYRHNFKNVITDPDDIYMFLTNGDCN